MGKAAALKVAIDLLRVPSRVRPVRAAELPHGVAMLLEIAAGDAEAVQRAAEHTGRTPTVVREAATFFIEQILFAPDADSYRVLGAHPEANSSELRRNMALLLRWLHPDMERDGNGAADRSVFAGRVTQAWGDLKTAERRAAYDAKRQNRAAVVLHRNGKSGRRAKSAKPSPGRQGRGVASRGRRGDARGGLWRALLALFGVPRH